MTTGKKWLTGCGVGCGALVLVALALMVLGFSYCKRFVDDIEESEQSQARLDASLGGVENYTPPRNGAVPPDRLEVFLAVREGLQPRHATMTEHLSDFPPADAGPTHLGPLQQLGVARGMAGFFRDLGGYMQERNEILLAQGMGLGEYYYIHTLVYHWWLGHDPIDGPELLYGSEHHDGVNLQFFDDDTNFGETGSRRRYRATVLRMLGRQLAAVSADPAGLPDGWAEALASEVAALESDPERMPWQDGLPAHVTAELEAHRESLEESYCPVTNVFDMHDAESGE